MFIFIFPTLLWAQWKCIDQVSGRYIYKHKQQIIKLDVCYKDSDNYLQWMNKRCYQHRGSCFREIEKLSHTLPRVRSKFGNPYFQKCLLIGGDAKLIELSIKQKWRSTSLCAFKNGNIVSITLLP